MDHFARCAFVVVLVLISACHAEPERKLLLVKATIADIQNPIKSGRSSCFEILQGYIDRIEKYDQAIACWPAVCRPPVCRRKFNRTGLCVSAEDHAQKAAGGVWGNIGVDKVDQQNTV